MSAELVERLRDVDVCALSDALERHGVAGVVRGLRSLAADRDVAGRAVTVELGVPGPETPNRHLGTAAVDASGPGDVIVVANAGRTDCAGWGGLLSTAAALRGVAGVVVDGALRDVPEAIEVGLPVHARTGTPVTARGRVVERSWNEPVAVDGVAVRPGDLVRADASGLVVVPADEAEAILATAEAIAARESAMAAALRRGVPVSEVMGTDYETLLRPEADHG